MFCMKDWNGNRRCLSVCLLICLSVCIFVCLLVYLHACQCACLSACVSACLSVCLSTCMFAFQPVCLPVCLHACLCACLCVCLPVCLSGSWVLTLLSSAHLHRGNIPACSTCCRLATYCLSAALSYCSEVLITASLPVPRLEKTWTRCSEMN